MKFLIPRLKPRYGIAEWIAAANIFSPGAVEKYEEQFAHKFECDFGAMFAHGRTGLYALFKVWELENAEVVCPSYTCVVVPNAIVLSGNVPVFVDCEKNSFNMSLKGIKNSITDKTRVIIATHLFGYPMDVRAVQKIADEASSRYGHKVYVVQDCAHSYGARWGDELVTKFGDAAFFGSNVSKIINSIFGGVVITNNEVLHSKLLKWKKENCKKKPFYKSLKRLVYFISVNIAFNPLFYSFVNWLERKGFLDRFVKYYEDNVIDFPVDWDQLPVDIEARIGMSQLKKYDQIISDRTQWARQIVEHYESDSSIRFMEDIKGATYSHLVGIVEERDAWVEAFREEHIQLGILIEYSIPNMSAYKKYKTVEVPNSDYFSKHCINFPLHRKIDL